MFKNIRNFKLQSPIVRRPVAKKTAADKADAAVMTGISVMAGLAKANPIAAAAIGGVAVVGGICYISRNTIKGLFSTPAPVAVAPVAAPADPATAEATTETK